MTNPDAQSISSLVDHLTAVREWLWRHSSQPNGDPWDSDPEHLDRAAHSLLRELARRLIPDSSPPTPSRPARPPRPVTARRIRRAMSIP